MAETQTNKAALTATNASVRIGLAGLGGIAVQVAGTFSGTITFEGSVDGVNFTPMLCMPVGSSTAVSTTTAAGLWTGNAVGLVAAQARMSSFSSGGADVTLRAVMASPGGGGGSSGGGGAVTIADGADVAEGAIADTAATASTGSWSVVALLKGALGKLISLAAQILDYDTGAGTANQVVVGLALPASGGPVGVSSSNPLPVTPYPNATWYTTHLPAANTVATITKASAGGSLKNVCTDFTVAISGGATAPAAVQLSVALIDGATGGTTYLWRSTIALPAVAGAISAFTKTGGWFVGTAATAMTLEFSIAGGLLTIESVSMSGTTTL